MAQKLTREYRRLNWQWWGGRLPDDILVQWSRQLADAGDYGQGVIRINAASRRWPSVWKATLLHEMVHVFVDEVAGVEEGDHGTRWLRERRRLYRAGAFEAYL